MIIKETREVKINMTNEEREVLRRAAYLLDDLINAADTYSFDEIALILEDECVEYFPLDNKFTFLFSVVDALKKFARGEIIMEKDDCEV